MKNKGRIITGLASLLLAGGLFLGKYYSSKGSFNLEKPVAVAREEAEPDFPLSQTRTNINAPLKTAVIYDVSPKDMEFRKNVLPGLSNYLASASVSYKDAHLNVPIDLTFKKAEFSKIREEVRGDKSRWTFIVDGHSAIYLYQEGKNGQPDLGYLSYLGPKLENDFNFLTQSKDTISLDELMKKTPEKGMSYEVADGLLYNAFSALPHNDRLYLLPQPTLPINWRNYEPNIYSGELVEDSPQYRANDRLNPGIKINIIGKGPKEAELLSFSMLLSDTNRFPYSKQPNENKHLGDK